MDYILLWENYYESIIQISMFQNFKSANIMTLLFVQILVYISINRQQITCF